VLLPEKEAKQIYKSTRGSVVGGASVPALAGENKE